MRKRLLILASVCLFCWLHDLYRSWSQSMTDLIERNVPLIVIGDEG